MKKTYIPKGVCTSQIEFEVDNKIVKNVRFTAGCSGNLQAIASLVEGMPVEEVINKTRGIKCGNKNTSCSDQLAKALENL